MQLWWWQRGAQMAFCIGWGHRLPLLTPTSFPLTPPKKSSNQPPFLKQGLYTIGNILQTQIKCSQSHMFQTLKSSSLSCPKGFRSILELSHAKLIEAQACIALFMQTKIMIFGWAVCYDGFYGWQGDCFHLCLCYCICVCQCMFAWAVMVVEVFMVGKGTVSSFSPHHTSHPVDG